MLLGCIADDFTGAGDLANTLSSAGMHTRIFIGLPGGHIGGCDAGVIALKSRSVPAADAVAQSLAALERLREAGCRQFVFKYCSTFDSTTEGNIGPVASALAQALDVRGVVVCPAFPATGRTVYQGHLFVGDRLLSESGMERHPLTPMSDPDIRRWLASQGGSRPGHIVHAVVRGGAAAIRSALAQHAQEGTTLVVVDAISDCDLRAIGRAAADALLVTGGSGIALELPNNFARAGLLSQAVTGFAACIGDAFALAGSCSSTTLAQVTMHLQDHPGLWIDPDRIVAGERVAEEAEAFLHRHRGEGPLIYSSAEAERVRSTQAVYGGATAAAAVEACLGNIAVRALAAGFERLVVAGGETSGAVTTALGITMLEIGPEIDPGVPMMSTTDRAGRPLALALKSGNFGHVGFFAKAMAVLGTPHG